MKLIIFVALTALCSAEKLDRTYLPPVSAKTAGGSPGSLQTPLVGSDELPAGSFVNDAQGVVVDAAASGTRASPGSEESSLGRPRESYGSTASKVGDAAFRESLSGLSQIPNTFSRIAPIPEHETVVGPVYGDQVFQSKSVLPQASKDSNSNTLSYENNVETHKYNYGFEADNGIAVGETGVAHDGIHAQGGYSYKGNDGQNYKVTYTADKGGYQPQGSHLPTPHPIPDEIVKSIEQNANEEAAGHYDDGSYDSQKYNAEGDYADSNKYNDKQSQFEKRPGSQANGVIINQNNQAGSVFPGFGSVSTNRPQAFNSYKPGYEWSQTGHSQVFPTNNAGTYGVGTSDSSSFGQNTQSSHNGSPSKSQFGQTSFESQYTTTQFGSQFAQGSKPSFTSQSVKPQLGINQPLSQGSSIIPSTPSTLTSSQFGSQTGQPSFTGSKVSSSTFGTTSGNKPGFPVQGTSFDKPVINSFGSSTYNFGQAGSSNLANQEYLPPVGSAKLPHGVEYQETQFGVGATPTFSGVGKPVGFVPQSSQESSATASAIVSGSQPSLSSLSPQVLGGLQRPSNTQPGQYTSQEQASLNPSLSIPLGVQKETYNSGYPSKPDTLSGSVQFGAQPSKTPSAGPQFGSKPVGLSMVYEPSSTYLSHSQNFESSEKKEPSQPAGFLTNTHKPNLGQQSQGLDYSYHYKQPAKPFSTPSSSLQASRYPGISSGQYSAVSGQQLSQTNNQLSSFTNTPSTQKEQFSGSNKFPTQTFGSISPTKNQVGSRPYQPSYNGVTQAAVSTFPSPPTPTSAFSQQVKPAQFSQKPTTQKEQTVFGQIGSTSSVDNHKSIVSSQNAPSVATQQYNGQLYEYNKPEQGIPSITPSSTPSSLNVFGQPTEESISQGSLSSSQFGPTSLSGNKPFSKPQFGSTQVSQPGSKFEVQKPQQVSTQLGFKPQSFQTTQLPNTQNVQGSQTQFSSQPYKPISTQFGQIPQTSQGSSFTQIQTAGTVSNTEQSGQSLPLKPFGSASQFGISGTKPQFGQTSVTSQETNLQQSTHQTTDTFTNPQKQSTQGTQLQNGYLPPSPFSIPSTFGVQGAKPQFGQGSQISQGSSFQQSTQTTQQTLSSVAQQGQGSQTQFGSQSHKPFGTISQIGGQGYKPQLGQLSQPSHGSTFQQSTQQSLTQQGHNTESKFGTQAYKPFGSTSQFGTQGTKPQFGQIPQKSQGSLFSQTQTTQQVAGTVSSNQQQSSPGYLSQLGTQPSKPTLFGVQETKPQFGKVPQSSHESSFLQTQTTQQTVGASTQQKPSLGSQSQFGAQSYKPFGSQFGTQGSNPQFGLVPQKSQGNSFTQTQNTQQTVGSVTTTQQQTTQPQNVYLPPKPLTPISQFGVQETKPQFGQDPSSHGNLFQQSTQTNQHGVGSQGLYSTPSLNPLGSNSQFGFQGTKPQGSSFTQTQSTQQSESILTQQQSGQSSLVSGSQQSKPFSSSSQFVNQGTKPQGSSAIQTQTGQQTESTFTQHQSGQGSQIFGSQPPKPFSSTSQFGIQGSKPQFGQVSQLSQGTSLTQTQTTQQTVGSGAGTQQQPSSQIQFGTQSHKPFGSTQISAQGIKHQFGQATHTTQQHGFTQSQLNQQSSYNKFSQPKPFTGSSPAPFGTQPVKTQFGSTAQKNHGSTISTTQFGSQFEQSASQGSSQFGAQSFKPFSTSHHQESKPQYGAPSKPLFGQSPTTYSPFTNTQNSQTQSGYQYKPFGNTPVNAFGKYQPKPQFGQTGYTGFGSSHASSSASSSHQPFKGTNFGSQQFRPFGTQYQPIKSQFGQTPTSSASAFASSSATTPAPYSSKFTLQPLKPFGTPSTVFSTSQPATPTLGQDVSGAQSTSVTFGQGSELGVQKPFGNAVSQASTPHPSKPNFGFSKPCCQASQFGSSTTQATPSFGISSTTPSLLQTPTPQSPQDLHTVEGSAQKTEDFSGPKQPQKFDDKTGYYY